MARHKDAIGMKNEEIKGKKGREGQKRKIDRERSEE
jgi:hypothetical protein